MSDLLSFQHELTQRLESSAPTSHSFVSILLDDQRWLVDLMLIKEASVPPKISKNARAPHWVVGITNFRGEVWTVVDMRMIIKKESTVNPNWGWVTLLHPSGDHKIALLWSEIVEIASKEEYDLVPNAPNEPFVRATWKDQKGQLWKELNADDLTGSLGLITTWRQKNDTEGRQLEKMG